jgi:hypothetical protein
LADGASTGKYTTVPANLILPSTIENINYLFQSWNNLKSLPVNFTIPDGVKYASHAFDKCNNLEFSTAPNFSLGKSLIDASYMFYDNETIT